MITNKSFWLILILFVYFASSISYSQIQQEWVAIYNGPANDSDYAKVVKVDMSGNVYVAGISKGIGTQEDYTVVKYNSSGQEQWVARYNGGANSYDIVTDMALDNSGNIYVTGFSAGIGTDEDYATVKFNPDGQLQWSARYNHSSNGYDIAKSIAVDAAGNVYVTGFSYGGSITKEDYATIKYNTNGQQQWVARYNSVINGYDIANQVKVDPAGNVYVTGFSQGAGTDEDYLTVKYNSAGQQQWTARYNGPANSYDIARSLDIDNLGNVYVTGFSDGGTSTKEDYATVKYSPMGLQLWVERYHGTGNDYDIAIAVATDAAGNAYVTGYSVGNNSDEDYATIKYSPVGQQLWVSRYNGDSNSYDIATSMAVDSIGNVYVTGFSFGGFSTAEDYATVKYNTLGQQEWVMRYDNGLSDYDIATSIAIDNFGSVYVTGWSIGIGGVEDFVTIKYSKEVSIQQTSEIIPEVFNLFQNYPNPFNSETVIRFALPKDNLISLKVFDIMGREVVTLVNEYLQAGEYSVTFSSPHINSGVYFYNLTAREYTQVRKMLIVK